MNAEYEEAVETLLASKEALNGFDTKLIGSLFADNPLYDGLDPHEMVRLAKDGRCDGFLIDTLTKDGRNLFDFLNEQELREMVFEGKELGMSTALSGHLRIENLDELARINPDIVGVRGAVCQKGDRQTGVHWEAVAEFKRQLDLRKTGEIDVLDGVGAFSSVSNGVDGAANGWIVIDGTGKTCAGIIAALSEQLGRDSESFIEVIIPDVLNTYDIIVWAQQSRHSHPHAEEGPGRPRPDADSALVVGGVVRTLPRRFCPSAAAATPDRLTLAARPRRSCRTYLPVLRLNCQPSHPIRSHGRTFNRSSHSPGTSRSWPSA